MAQQGIQSNEEKLSCSICLELLKDPVTTPCGHSFCMMCLKMYWDSEAQKEIYRCPQCRQTFLPRPVLKKNTILADIIEGLRKTADQEAPGDHCYAAAEDVACDFCTGRKLKAVKSCLQCLVSYCEQHLQPHHDVAALKKHTLVDPSKKLQENICCLHGEVMNIFCCTDQLCICYLCSVDEHKGHNTVSAVAERKERQKELAPSLQKIQKRIEEIDKDMIVLLREEVAINCSADEAVADSEKIFNELIQIIEKKYSDVKEQVRSTQRAEVSRAKELYQRMKEEKVELRRKEADLEQLSHCEDHTQFLQMFPLLSEPGETTKRPDFKPRPLNYFKAVTMAVSDTNDKLQSVFSEEWPRISQSLNQVNVLLPHSEPTTRAEFLQYGCQITLDPDSVNRKLVLSEGNRRATYVSKKQMYSSHPDRFMDRSQVLSRERLTGRHYWEVEWDDFGVFIGLSYKNISKTGECSEFGNNKESWVLLCSPTLYEFSHNGVSTSISAPTCFRVGVYLDHSAGILSFYGVDDGADIMTLIHRVHTTFTQPLHAALRAYYFLGSGSTAVFCQPR